MADRSPMMRLLVQEDWWPCERDSWTPWTSPVTKTHRENSFSIIMSLLFSSGHPLQNLEQLFFSWTEHIFCYEHAFLYLHVDDNNTITDLMDFTQIS